MTVSPKDMQEILRTNNMILKALIENVFFEQTIVDVFSDKTSRKKDPGTAAVIVTSTEITIGGCLCVTGTWFVTGRLFTSTVFSFDRRTLASRSASNTISANSATVRLSCTTWDLAFRSTREIAPMRHLIVRLKS